VIYVNGFASPFFKTSRGLRQGCPLSPLLFRLVTRGFSRLLGRLKSLGKIKGLPIRRDISISHALFVDDVLILGTRSKLKERK
jgi:hypothetical protein